MSRAPLAEEWPGWQCRMVIGFASTLDKPSESPQTVAKKRDIDKGSEECTFPIDANQHLARQ